MNDKHVNFERSEEIQDIVERMPNRFGIVITYFLIILLSLTFFFSWIIKYPDVIKGEIIINDNNSPVKLIANASGKLKLIKSKSMDSVEEGEYIAIIQNSAKSEDVVDVRERLERIDLNDEESAEKFSKLPKNVSLGEVNTTYFHFLNIVNEYVHRKEKYLFEEQNDILIKALHQQQDVLTSNYKKLVSSKENFRIVSKFLSRDSLLFSKKVLTEADYDKSKINRLLAQDNLDNVLADISVASQQIKETQNNLKKNEIQKNEKEQQIWLDLISSLSDLKDNIKAWEQKYVFKSPYRGKVQFLGFWNDNEYVQQGEPIFTIIRKKTKVFGQMMLPAYGAGKAKVGQKVVIKLANYPYMEYGSIEGTISSISLTTNSIRNQKEENVETYLLSVALPQQLKTNYGAVLSFGTQNKGTGEIITKDRRLIQRLFDNLKYVGNSNL